MSSLAKKIAPDAKVVARRREGVPGPPNECWPLYGEGDLDDWEAVDALRFTRDPETGAKREWRDVHREVDQLLGIEDRIDLERFRRHWRRRCDCWPKGLKL